MDPLSWHEGFHSMAINHTHPAQAMPFGGPEREISARLKGCGCGGWKENICMAERLWVWMQRLRCPSAFVGS